MPHEQVSSASEALPTSERGRFFREVFGSMRTEKAIWTGLMKLSESSDTERTAAAILAEYAPRLIEARRRTDQAFLGWLAELEGGQTSHIDAIHHRSPRGGGELAK